jgi:pyruvate dehydrogenase E1 component alpha subunit
VRAEADAAAAQLRARMNVDTELDPMSLFDNVFAEPTPQLIEQREQVRAELAAAQDGEVR